MPLSVEVDVAHFGLLGGNHLSTGWKASEEDGTHQMGRLYLDSVAAKTSE